MHHYIAEVLSGLHHEGDWNDTDELMAVSQDLDSSVETGRKQEKNHFKLHLILFVT